MISSFFCHPYYENLYNMASYRKAYMYSYKKFICKSYMLWRVRLMSQGVKGVCATALCAAFYRTMRAGLPGYA